MIDLFRDSGETGVLILLSVLALTGYSAHALFASTRRHSYWLLLVFSAIPLVLGVVGSALGHRRVAELARGAHPREAEVGHRIANAPLLLGGGACLVFVLLAVLGLLLQRDGEESLL